MEKRKCIIDLSSTLISKKRQAEPGYFLEFGKMTFSRFNPGSRRNMEEFPVENQTVAIVESYDTGKIILIEPELVTFVESFDDWI